MIELCTFNIHIWIIVGFTRLNNKADIYMTMGTILWSSKKVQNPCICLIYFSFQWTVKRLVFLLKPFSYVQTIYWLNYWHTSRNIQHLAAVSCSLIVYRLGGVGFGIWWRTSWAVHGIGAWVVHGWYMCGEYLDVGAGPLKHTPSTHPHSEKYHPDSIPHHLC